MEEVLENDPDELTILNKASLMKLSKEEIADYAVKVVTIGAVIRG